MNTIIFDGFNFNSVEDFIKDNLLVDTELVKCEGEILCEGRYFKAPCLLMVNPLSLREECIVIPMHYVQHLNLSFS